MLIKKYKNQIYNTLNRKGFNPKDFIIEDINENGYDIGQLRYKRQEMLFQFISSKDSFHYFDVRYKKFDKGLPWTDLPSGSKFIEFEIVLGIFSMWLDDELSEYINETVTKDLWLIAESNKGSLKLDYIDFDDNSPFTLEEKEQLKLGLNEAKTLLLKEFNFNEHQMKVVEKRLQYLGESIERNTKTDWKGIAVSTIIGLILNLGIDTESGKLVWDLFGKVLDNLPSLPF